MYQGQGSSEVMLVENVKLVGLQFFWKVEVQLQQNLICRCNLWTSYLMSGWGLVKLSFFLVTFMQVIIILEFPASYFHLASGIAQVYLLYSFKNDTSILKQIIWENQKWH